MNNPVGAELIVCGALSEISAVGLEFFAVPVFFIQSLVNIIPDKASLIQRLCICQIRVFMHSPAGISHGVSIFAADKRFAPVFFQEFFNVLHRSIHLAFHIAGVVVSPVMENSFIMDQTGRIFSAEELRHFKNVLSSKRLVAAGPDQDRRMVLISLVHRVGTVQHHIQPFRPVAGHYP